MSDSFSYCKNESLAMERPQLKRSAPPKGVSTKLLACNTVYRRPSTHIGNLLLDLDRDLDNRLICASAAVPSKPTRRAFNEAVFAVDQFYEQFWKNEMSYSISSCDNRGRARSLRGMANASRMKRGTTLPDRTVQTWQYTGGN